VEGTVSSCQEFLFQERARPKVPYKIDWVRIIARSLVAAQGEELCSIDIGTQRQEIKLSSSPHPASKETVRQES
jgi:hypothetical protein